MPHCQCSIYNLKGVPSNEFKTFTSVNGRKHPVPIFDIFCPHAHYELTELLRASTRADGHFTDVSVYKRKEKGGSLSHVVLKTVDPYDSHREAGSVGLIERLGAYRRERLGFVRAKLLHESTCKSCNPEEPSDWSAIVMQKYECTLHCLCLVTMEQKMHAFKQIVRATLRLWQCNLAYLDFKETNVLFSSAGGQSTYVLCDHGAVEIVGTTHGSATYPPPTNPFGTEVSADAINVCWGLGSLLVLLLEPRFEEQLRYVSNKEENEAGHNQPIKFTLAILEVRRAFKNYPQAIQNLLDTCWSTFVGKPLTAVRDVYNACH